MRKITSLTVLAGLVGFGLQATPAHAQLARTFVSAANGDDANDCNRPTPCRTFQTAHNKTLDQGEITVLDVGGYGAVTITKSISIVNDGVGEASILVSGGNTGITVNAPATASVNVRGITVQGIGFGGGNGVQFNSGAALTMTNCVIRTLTGYGIGFFPVGASKLALSHTLVADNGATGIHVKTVPTSIVKATLKNVEVYNNADAGVAMVAQPGGTIDAAVEDSVAAGNGLSGFLIGAAAGYRVNLTVARSVSANNFSGLTAAGGNDGAVNGYLYVSQSVITGNSHDAWTRYVGGAVYSFADNYIVANGDGDPFPPTIPRK
jgi:hypothetical protein